MTYISLHTFVCLLVVVIRSVWLSPNACFAALESTLVGEYSCSNVGWSESSWDKGGVGGVFCNNGTPEAVWNSK